MIAQSFFIPQLPFDITKEQVRQYFSKYGNVCRVDFVAFTNARGGNGRRGYVHYSYYHDTSDFQTTFNACGFVDIDSFDFGSKQFMVVRVLKNNKPIPQTTLNLDQVAHNTIFIGDQQKEIQTKIQNQEDRISALENKLQEQDDTIKKLLVLLEMQNIPPSPPKPLQLMIPTESVHTIQEEPAILPGKKMRKIVMY